MHRVPSPLIALARGKAGKREGEDLLSSVVLGTLASTPTGLQDLLATHPALAWCRAATLVDVRFWPWWDEHHALAGAEPDVVVVLDAPGSGRRLLVIEAKHRSGKSGHGAHDQLARQYASGLAVAERRGAAFSGVVYLTSHLAAPREDLAASAVQIRDRLGVAAPLLFWATWRDATPLLDAVAETQAGLLAATARDAAAYLRRLHLVRFAGLTQPTPTPAWTFSRTWDLSASPLPRWTFDRSAP